MEVESFNVPFVWDYVHKIPELDYQEFEIAEGQIPHAYETGGNKFVHLLVATKTANVFMVILLNTQNEEIYGHHLLDLNEEYEIARD